MIILISQKIAICKQVRDDQVLNGLLCAVGVLYQMLHVSGRGSWGLRNLA